MPETSPEAQVEAIRRGAVDFIGEEDLLRKLRGGGRLAVKVGFDPTAPDLHLGHTVVMRKMRQLQDLGHRVVFVIGDFTGRIGDPTGRRKTRPPLADEDLRRNAETYRAQAFKVLDPERTEVRFNGEWLGALAGAEVVRLAAQYTVARMIERDDFARRFAEGRPISIHELLYPLFQAYDSVALRCDLEMGGADQIFNLLVGREVMRGYGLAPQAVLTMPLLEGIDAREEGGRIVGEKMSKSLGNCIALDDTPAEMYGKLMSICDGLMWRYYELLSALDPEAIRRLRDDTASGGTHPRDAKAALAREIVERYHGAEAASAAAARFDRVHRERATPDEIPEAHVGGGGGGIPLARACAQAGLAPSVSDARRMVEQGGVSVDGARASDPMMPLEPGRSYLVRAGKRRFARLSVRRAEGGRE